MKLSVEVQQSLRPNLPNVLASFSATIETEAGPIRVNDGRIIQSKTGAVWCSLPTFSVSHSGRQFEYKSTVELPPGLVQQISNEALRAYEQWKSGNAR